MIKIITTGKQPIEFLLRRGRQILISDVPVTVTEEEFVILDSRLGNQIAKHSEKTTAAAAAPVASAPAQTIAPAPTANSMEGATNVEG